MALEGGEGSGITPRPLFNPGKDLVPIVQEVGCTPGPVWTGAENRPPPGFDPRTVQPVDSCYTNYATQSTKTYIQFTEYCELYNMTGKQRHKNTYCELYRVAWTKLGSPGVQHGLLCRHFCSYLVLVCYPVVRISQVPACNMLCMILQLVF